MLPRLFWEAKHPKGQSVSGVVGLDVTIAPLTPLNAKAKA